jgi:di/tricarboxylate transporter
MIEVHTPDFHIAATLILIVLAVILYATERLSIERTSIVILAVLMLVFELAPLTPQAGHEKINAALLLRGFANPALIAVVCLLIVGEGLSRTGALDWLVRFILRVTGYSGAAAILLTFATVLIAGAFLNNTPVVIMFIPILESVVRQHGIAASRLMMPLSFIAIMAGMTTLIGSSTNLLISGTMEQLTGRPLGFFEFTVPGLGLAAVGIAYLVFIGPRLLKDRSSPMGEITESPNRRYIAQLTVGESSKLVGDEVSGDLLGISGSRVILLQREEQAFSPPYDGIATRPGDTLVILATLEALAQAQTTYPHLHFAVSDEDLPADDEEAKARRGADQMLAEVMVAPGSRFEGGTLKEAGFHANFGCLVLGIERRAHVIRKGITDLRMRPGDILVIQGSREDLDRVRASHDFVVMDGSAQSLPAPHLAQLAGVIFAATVVSAAAGILPIAVAAFAGVALMVTTHVLTLRQAVKAVADRRWLDRRASRLRSCRSGFHPVSGSGGDDEPALKQRYGGAVHAHRHRPGPRAGHRSPSLRPGRPVRRELRLRDPDRLSDQSAGDGTGLLHLQRLRPHRRSAGAGHVAGLHPADPLVLRSLGRNTCIQSNTDAAIPMRSASPLRSATVSSGKTSPVRRFSASFRASISPG